MFEYAMRGHVDDDVDLVRKFSHANVANAADQIHAIKLALSLLRKLTLCQMQLTLCCKYQVV